MAKYDPLRELLFTRGEPKITLTFDQIEQAIGATLPKSAHEYAAFWANTPDTTHVHADAWLAAGYKVDAFDLSARWVRFVKSR